MGHFFRLCLKAAFAQPLWEKAQGVAAAIICSIGLITYAAPKLFPDLQKHEIKEWQILSLVFALLILLRLVLSPYWVVKEITFERDKYRKKLQREHMWEKTLDEIKDGIL